MDRKTLQTLEYPKILERLANYCAFAVSAEKARALQPCRDIELARRRQAETREAIRLLGVQSDLTIGGARDIRQAVDLATHGGLLTPGNLLDIKSTLIASRTLGRTFERLESQYPFLAEIASRLPPPFGLIDAISRAISERGEILDSASTELNHIRSELRIVHDRLLAKLQRMVNDPKNAPLLQEPIVTQRDGRYVLPLRAEFKGRIKSIVHDQSSSGATIFIEPVAVVDQNNQYRELLLAERDEERRILAELSQQVSDDHLSILTCVEVIAELDLIFARGKYADELKGTEPVLQPMPSTKKSDHPGCIIRIYEARHPLLDPQTVVPIDVDLDPQTYALIITGPNTGGKTVTLKTIGLLALMAQAGLHIPAQSGSEISLFNDIFADIGDEQSIEQSLSTFSGHITNIIRILEKADQRSLVILDELGAGTDPQEGAALARAILLHLLKRGITTFVTTHHPELKAFAHATPGVVNASAEFDLETLRPTYHLSIGLPGRSNALAIAQRLGLPEEIIHNARAELDPEDLRAEDLLDEIHRQRDVSRQNRLAAEAYRQEAEDLHAELVTRLENIEDERRSILEKARAEAENELKELQAEIRQTRRALARTRQPIEVLEQIEEQTDTILAKVEKPVERQTRLQRSGTLTRAIRLGDKVHLRSLDVKGVVTSLGEEEAEVQVGVLRVRARLSELRPLAGGEQQDLEPTQEMPLISSQSKKGSKQPSIHYASSPGIELDLRGKRADEALEALERYLDSAYLAGLPFVRIIHGKGTGKLRDTVRQALTNHPHVTAYEAGSDKEGGDGVTIAKFSGG